MKSGAKITIPLLLILIISGCISSSPSPHLPQHHEQAKYTTIQVYFAPFSDETVNTIIALINSSNKSIHAAVYDLDLESIAEVLEQAKARGVDVEIVSDDRQAKRDESKIPELSKIIPVVLDNSEKDYMHNKFFVIDSKIVITGSTNPTYNGFYRNNNNLVIIYSDELAENYEEEFQELYSGTFGGGAPTDEPEVSIDGVVVENYFCPEDSCESQVLEELSKAKHEVYFMTFTFTSRAIAEKLAELESRGVQVYGIYEARQKSRYCTFDFLKQSGAEVIWDKNPYTMHHKVFIIDNETVITGSYNPTKHANVANDENILVIHDKEIAEKYAEEFFDLWEEWS
ncbi:MAG TPA: hypothetical protein ENG00_01575 [Candidatus Aenigmarchaeota archaeon]|nr:hypothetical protein [Candidatus Aenigmarchaeota archaeon]